MNTEIKEWLAGKRDYYAGVKLYLEHGKSPLLKKAFQEGWSPFKQEKLLQALSSEFKDQSSKSTVQSSKPQEVAATTPPDAHSQELQELKSQTEDIADNLSSLEYTVEDIESNTASISTDVTLLRKDVQKLKEEAKTAPKGWPAEMDEYVSTLHEHWLPLFAERANLRSRIYEVALAGEKEKEKKEEACTMAHRILWLRDRINEIYAERDEYQATGKVTHEQKPLDIPADPKRWPLLLQNYQKYLRDYKAKLVKKPGNEAFEKQVAKYEWGVSELKKHLDIN
jgi:predicted  nucleic acid-binding Zn-ribbon protein